MEAKHPSNISKPHPTKLHPPKLHPHINILFTPQNQPDHQRPSPNDRPFCHCAGKLDLLPSCFCGIHRSDTRSARCARRAWRRGACTTRGFGRRLRHCRVQHSRYTCSHLGRWFQRERRCAESERLSEFSQHYTGRSDLRARCYHEQLRMVKPPTSRRIKHCQLLRGVCSRLLRHHSLSYIASQETVMQNNVDHVWMWNAARQERFRLSYNQTCWVYEYSGLRVPVEASDDGPSSLSDVTELPRYTSR